MSDSDPPPYTPERPVAWILLFIHHMVKCGVCDIVPQDLSASTGGELISSADPHLRQKLARRMGFAQDPDDVALICAIDEKDEASACVEAASKKVGASAAADDSRTSVLEKPPPVSSSSSSSEDDSSSSGDEDDVSDHSFGSSDRWQYLGENFAVRKARARAFENAVEKYKASSQKVAAHLRIACAKEGGDVLEIDPVVSMLWQRKGVTFTTNDGALMLSALIQHSCGEDGCDTLRQEFADFHQDDASLSAFVAQFLAFVTLFMFAGIKMRSARCLKSLKRKLAEQHRDLLVGRTSYSSAMAVLMEKMALTAADEVRHAQDDAVAMRARARAGRMVQGSGARRTPSAPAPGNDGAPPRGSPSKSKTCYHWDRDQTCPYGDACKFEHIAKKPVSNKPKVGRKAQARLAKARRASQDAANGPVPSGSEIEPTSRRAAGGDLVDQEIVDISVDEFAHLPAEPRARQAVLCEPASEDSEVSESEAESDGECPMTGRQLLLESDSLRPQTERSKAVVLRQSFAGWIAFAVLFLACLIRGVATSEVPCHADSMSTSPRNLVFAHKPVVSVLPATVAGSSLIHVLHANFTSIYPPWVALSPTRYDAIFDTLGDDKRVLIGREIAMIVRPWSPWMQRSCARHVAASLASVAIMPLAAVACCCPSQADKIVFRVKSSWPNTPRGPQHRRKPQSVPSAKIRRRKLRSGVPVVTTCSQADREKRDRSFDDAVARPAKCERARRVNPRQPKCLPACLDSGSTHHVGTDRTRFDSDFHLVKDKRMKTFQPGPGLKIVGVGTYYQPAVDDITGKPCVIPLPNTLYIPDGEQDLISTECLEREGHRIVHDQSDPKSGISFRRNGVTALHVRTPYDGQQYVLRGGYHVTSIPAARRCTLHRVLGHCNPRDAASTQKRSDGLGAADPVVIKCCECPVCLSAKMTEASRSKDSATKADVPTQRLHADIVVMPKKSFSGARYNLTVTCSNTGYHWQYATKSRSGLDAVVLQLKEDIEPYITEGVAIVIRSDNELAQGSFRAAAKRLGWKCESTAPNSSFQNGTGERPFRTIMDCVRAMLADARLGPAFWELAYSHAVFLSNRISRNGKPSAYQQLTGKRPDFTNVQPFGELVAVWIHHDKRHKLQSRCQWGICVGVSVQHPSDTVSVFLPQTKRTVVTRSWRVVPRAPSDKSPGMDRWRFAPSTYGAVPLAPDSLPEDGGENRTKGVASSNNPPPIPPPPETPVDPIATVTEWKKTPRDNMTTLQIARWLQADPHAYLDFVRDFQMGGYKHITMRSKWHKATDVPVPDAAYRSICRMRARARTAVSFSDEPGGTSPSYNQTLARRDASGWVDGRLKQWKDIQEGPPSPTLDVMDRSKAPPDIEPVRSVWVNNTKVDSDGNVTELKSRICGNGASQCAGKHYDPRYISAIPVRFSSVLMCFAIAAQLGLDATQCDFSAAYVNATMKEDLWMYCPEGVPGIPHIGADGKRRVCKVLRSLFGFKQSGAAWTELLDNTMRAIGNLPPVGKSFSPDLAPPVGIPGLTCTVSASDPNVYRYDRGGEVCIVCIYSDDCLLFSSCPKLRDDIVRAMKHFKLRDLGQARSFLGVKIEKNLTKGGGLAYTLSMPGYIKKLLKDNQMHEANAVSRPASPNEKISDAGEECSDPSAARSCIGGLLWAAVTVRPDILSATNVLCRHMHCPTPTTVVGMKRVCRYLRGTIDRGMTFSCPNPSLRNQKKIEFEAYSDADWGDDVDTGRSTSGHVLMMSGAAFSNRSRLEKPVSMSSCESEAMAMCGAVQEIDYFRGFLGELKLGDLTKPTRLYVDNRSAILDAHNTTGRRTRHMNLRFHRVRQSIRDGTVSVDHVRGGVATDSMQVADIHTKATNTALFRKFAGNIMGEVQIERCKMPPLRDG